MNKLKITFMIKTKNNFVSTKVSVFQQEQINSHPNHPKGLAWHEYQFKPQKHI